MIGNYADAAAALAGELSTLSEEGTARIVYRNADRTIVYKVDREIGGNMAEWRNYQFFMEMELPTGISIPKMTLYPVGNEYVIAAEYIPGVETGECYGRMCDLPCECGGECLSESEERMVNAFITDIAWGNVIKFEDSLYIIDLEC